MMMNKIQRGALAAFAMFAVLASGSAQAVILNLFDIGLNIDGNPALMTAGDPVPPEADLSGFDDIMGLGKIKVNITGAGPHTVVGFFDHEIDEPTNTYFNEFGFATGTPVAGQSWEIDEPSFLFGDIFFNWEDSNTVIGSQLDGTNGVPAGLEDDVSLAMGWDFTLGVDEVAVVEFLLSDSVMPTGFFLTQVDPDSDYEFYLSSSLTIKSIPEPGVIWLILAGVAGLAGIRKRQV